MQTRTMPRRSAAQSHRAGRFSRTAPPSRGRRRPQQKTGLAAKAMRAMPMMGGGTKSRRRGRKGGSSKAAPAVGLLMAGAGAIFGRRQMKRRREAGTTDMPPTA